MAFLSCQLLYPRVNLATGTPFFSAMKTQLFGPRSSFPYAKTFCCRRGEAPSFKSSHPNPSSITLRKGNFPDISLGRRLKAIYGDHQRGETRTHFLDAMSSRLTKFQRTIFGTAWNKGEEEHLAKAAGSFLSFRFSCFIDELPRQHFVRRPCSNILATLNLRDRSRARGLVLATPILHSEGWTETEQMRREFQHVGLGSGDQFSCTLLTKSYSDHNEPYFLLCAGL